MPKKPKIFGKNIRVWQSLNQISRIKLSRYQNNKVRFRVNSRKKIDSLNHISGLYSNQKGIKYTGLG